jgi:hypothetical protein
MFSYRSLFAVLAFGGLLSFHLLLRALAHRNQNLSGKRVFLTCLSFSALHSAIRDV